MSIHIKHFSFFSSIDVLGLVSVRMVTIQPELLSDHHLGEEMGGGSLSFGSPSRVHYLIQPKSQKVKTLTV